MAGQGYRLVIGDKNLSSWSLRPWVAMKHANLAFEEVRIKLRSPETKAHIRAQSPAGKVPALWDGDLLVWDSLAILEYIADRHPEAKLWPDDPSARAVARSAAAEMHSGFQALREHCPMNLLAREPRREHAEGVELNIRRIVQLWQDCRQSFGGDGPFLFSRFSVADAMYAPVASRFRTYIEDLGAFGDDGTAAAYVDSIFALPAMQAWTQGAREETEAAG